jgi:hypothetical protein
VDIGRVSEPVGVTALKHGHWQIENRLHYIKDVTLSEDGLRQRFVHPTTMEHTIKNSAATVHGRPSLQLYRACQRQSWQ